MVVGAHALTQVNERKNGFAHPASMRARIGNALYWVGCFLSAVVVALGIWIVLTDDHDGLWPLPTYLVSAAVVWLAGRIFRNVVSEAD
jgi:hypothetical protein